MGAWWANDPWIWWEALASVAAIILAIGVIIVIARVGDDESA